MKKKILVLTDQMPWGHRSIARAIYGHLKAKEKENNWQVDYTEVKSELGIGNEVYTFLCRYLPLSHRLAHHLAATKSVRDLGVDVAMKGLPRLKKEVRKFDPDLIISTYFLHSQCLGRWKSRGKEKFKLWTIVADPWSINPISFMKAAEKNIVYDEIGIERAVEYGLPMNKIFKSGWWVREEMYQKINRKEARKKLGIKDDRPVVFVGGGSLGTSSITRFLPALMMVKNKVAVLFNTGTDKLAFSTVNEYMRLYRKLKGDDNQVIIKNLGWVDNMAEVLTASDIVFGKAGPNFLFDTVAVKRPFVAITHVGGQEDGNIDLIRVKKLGWIKERGDEMVDFFLKFVDNPKRYLTKFSKTIAKESEENKKGLKRIEELVRREG